MGWWYSSCTAHVCFGLTFGVSALQLILFYIHSERERDRQTETETQSETMRDRERFPENRTV